MSYFILSQDNRILDAVEPAGLTSLLTKEMLTEETVHLLDELVLQVPIQQREHVTYVDFIQRPFPLLSDRLKQLVVKYVPKMLCKAVVLADREQMRQDLYWVFVPPRIDCLSDKTEFYQDNTMKRLILDQNKIGRRSFFRINGIREEHLVVNLGLAESILRRDFTGIQLQKVELEVQREDEMKWPS
ncbi:serine protease [Brevibacillus laterosporus]|uniref:Serine protease n=1 Tax=Brevibacillus laterosporus TaxID=1465 RepID=A0AAP3DGK4_BRELA|nr:serine protease [Brevibacillus laterosporus]MCR8979565.1 serine protease [Brevibacillus laterosporus]MCZ0806720.1 serine protease [Brevibacillus laterosporus]MCZ0825756.1 serine protease [Brevibacillus laterosporus]MCZ0849534.1 serine protease [Brevibacillus laterosporus]MED1662590.1 serine protease [Brevibacillus laterosporus]